MSLPSEQNWLVLQRLITDLAKKGYEIKDVLVDGKSVGTVSKYTFKNVKAKHTLEATFKKVEISEQKPEDIETPEQKPEGKETFKDVKKNGFKPITITVKEDNEKKINFNVVKNLSK